MRANLYAYLIVIALVLSGNRAFALTDQPLFFTHFTAEQSNLSHNGALCLLEDSRGYVWIGTKMGLNRYDGKRIKTFFSRELPSNYILSLCEDKQGNVWIGTSNGLACYNPNKDYIKNIEFHNDSASCFIPSIVCDTKGEVWFDAGTSSLFSISNDASSVVEHKLGLPDCNKKLSIDGRNRIAINCNQNDIFLFDGETVVPLLSGWAQNGIFANDEFNNPVFSRKSNDILYIASKRNGLCEVNISTRKVSTLHKWSSGQKPVSLYLDNNETLYICTSSGLITYDLRKNIEKTYLHSSSDSYSISGDYLTCAMVDSRGSLWVGAREYGVNYSRKEDLFKRVYAINAGENLNGCMVRGLSEDEDGMIWIATERKGLLKYNPGDNSLFQVFVNRLPFFITSVLCDGKFVWLGTQYGIIRINERDNSIKYFYTDRNADRENRVLSLFITSRDVLLVGCTSGVLTFDETKGAFYPIRELDGFSIEGFAEDSDGKIWLATYSDGVVRWDPSNAEPLRRFGQKTSTMVSSVYIDNSQRIWIIGNDSEFSLYDRQEDSFIKYNNETIPSLPEASYISALQDSDGYLWLSTTSGLLRFDPLTNTLRHFTSGHGLLNDCFGRAALKMSSGELLFGSLDGLICMNPSVNKIIGVAPQHTDIVSITADGKHIEQGSEEIIHIPAGTSSLTVDIAAPGSGGIAAVYSNLLPSTQGAKDISSQMSVTYEDLKPGIFNLEISSHPSIKVIIDKPFFLSAEGIALIAVILLALTIIIYLIANHFNRQAQERKSERLRLDQEAQMMHDKMNFMSNVVHEIKTPLTLIKTPLNNLKRMSFINSNVDKNLQIISNGVNSLDNLSKELLSFIRVEKCTYKVDIKPTELVDAVNLISFNFSEVMKDRNLEFVLDTPKEPVYVEADSKSLNTIISNLLGNAVKFAQTYIEVKVEKKDEGAAFLVVSNDGNAIPANQREEIFKPFVSLDPGRDAYQHSFGIGLPFSRKLAELQNGSLYLSTGDKPEFVLKLKLADYAISQKPFQADENFKDGRASLLIIEDNTQLCEYISEKLSDDFNVLSAYSAERGFSILSSRPVDVVVTDLNMPGIGGEELCRRISMDFETSHIPIIVISALSDEDLKLKCIENGANVFIEKPFTIEFLKANISNILDKLTKMRTSAQQDISGRFDLTRFGIKDRDEEFIQKLSAVVDKHLDDCSFSVKQFEDELFISHSSLNRKLSGLLKMSPIDFIRMRRLIAAAKILEDGNSNVSEVAFMVGFSTPAYFSKCFRRQFGITPREFIDKKMG